MRYREVRIGSWIVTLYRNHPFGVVLRVVGGRKRPGISVIRNYWWLSK